MKLVKELKSQGELRNTKFKPVEDKPDRKLPVFKIQRPMGMMHGPELALIYNKTRTYFGQVPMNDELREFMGGEYKVYAYGMVDKDGFLTIFDIADSQDW